jgi:flagellar biosynthesis chaperone FliJ
MMLETRRQVEATRRKLALLEEQYERTRRDAEEDEHLRELTLRSLKQFINQLKEEIAVFECHATTQSHHEETHRGS